MRVIRTVAEMRAAVAEVRVGGAGVGLVPTMGAFHDGHLSLMRRCREVCGFVVVSLFVNPTQFNDAADLARYPRDEDRDLRMAREVGVDVLFAPPADEIYPAGFSTSVEVSGIATPLEGTARGPSHFRGVATVVAKLFNVVRPDVAVFGQKDVQQTLVIRRMTRDLDFPVRIEVCPTVREADGLAMSSRNARLDPPARVRATALSRALRIVEDAVARGEANLARAMRDGRAVLDAAGIEPEYFSAVSPETLDPVTSITGETIIAIAASVGGVRLIDNVLITPRQETTR